MPAIDVSTLALLPCSAVALFGMLSLAYGHATWHLGLVKRVFLRGQLIFFVGAACWASEETGMLPCPMRFSLHPIWHVCVAHTLMAWSAFLKYHRGHFFGFKVEIRGQWWCPYAVWLAPDDPMSNPIIRHAAIIDCPAAAGRGGRRNTYLLPKLPRPAMHNIRRLSGLGALKQVWRGESFFDPDAARMQWGQKLKLRDSRIALTPFLKAWQRLKSWVWLREQRTNLRGTGIAHALEEQKPWQKQERAGTVVV